MTPEPTTGHEHAPMPDQAADAVKIEITPLKSPDVPAGLKIVIGDSAGMCENGVCEVPWLQEKTSDVD